MVDGVAHPLVPGTACFLGYDVKHEIINEGDDELVMMWVISPPGLEDFFRASAGRASPASRRHRPSRAPPTWWRSSARLGMNDTVA